MPLVNKKPFDLAPHPENLDEEELIWCCRTTNEIFRNYEEFYRRTILYNSLVWSCSITEKGGLTYQEAKDCEKSVHKKIKKIPKAVKIAIYFLVSKVKRRKIDQLTDVVYNFIKEQYFVGEEVEYNSGKLRRGECVILEKRVSASLRNSTTALTAPLTPDQIEYLIRYGKEDEAETKVVTSMCIRRRPGVLNRTICRLALKANCCRPPGKYQGQYIVKDEVVASLGLSSLRWHSMFVGPEKIFEPLAARSSENKKAVKPKAVNNGGKCYLLWS